MNKSSKTKQKDENPKVTWTCYHCGYKHEAFMRDRLTSCPKCTYHHWIRSGGGADNQPRPQESPKKIEEQPIFDDEDAALSGQPLRTYSMVLHVRALAYSWEGAEKLVQNSGVVIKRLERINSYKAPNSLPIDSPFIKASQSRRKAPNQTPPPYCSGCKYESGGYWADPCNRCEHGSAWKGRLTFKRLQCGVKEWAEHNFGEQKPYRPLLGVTEEVGELAHAQLKMEQGIRGSVGEHIAEAKDAVGDIIIYLADYCARSGFDMQTIIEEVWGKVSQRDWKKNPETGEKTTTVSIPGPNKKLDLCQEEGRQLEEAIIQGLRVPRELLQDHPLHAFEQKRKAEDGLTGADSICAEEDEIIIKEMQNISPQKVEHKLIQKALNVVRADARYVGERFGKEREEALRQLREVAQEYEAERKKQEEVSCETCEHNGEKPDGELAPCGLPCTEFDLWQKRQNPNQWLIDELSDPYQGKCVACNVEASLGTEEVPHPIDARVHTCTEETNKKQESNEKFNDAEEA